jgi:hypothetical protein
MRYIGTAEVAKNHADDDEQLHMGPGHPRKLPVLLRTYSSFAEADEVDASVAYLASKAESGAE